MELRPLNIGGRLTLCAFALAAAACSDRPAEDSVGLLPTQLHGLQRVEIRTGDEAAGLIGRLHQRDVATRESQIGVYGNEDMGAVLYVSVFPTADEAAAQFEAMIAAINEGVPGYGHHTHFEVTQRDVHVVFGDGRIHYFYADGDRLTWLGVQQPMIARAALAELLSVPVDSIPRLPGTPRLPEQDVEGA